MTWRVNDVITDLIGLTELNRRYRGIPVYRPFLALILTVAASAQTFRLGVNYSEYLPSGLQAIPSGAGPSRLDWPAVPTPKAPSTSPP